MTLACFVDALSEMSLEQQKQAIRSERWMPSTAESRVIQAPDVSTARTISAYRLVDIFFLNGDVGNFSENIN